MSSIRLRLLKSLIAPVLLIHLAVGGLTYALAWMPSQAAFDQAVASTRIVGGTPEERMRSARAAVQLHVQRERAQDAMLRGLVLAELLSTIAIVGLIWISVSRGLQPLARMRSILARRNADQLEPVDPGPLPRELAPVAAAFNELLAKVEQGSRAQHDFLANVAHQLRTPLAGLQLQIEFLSGRHAADADAMRALRMMGATNERMIRQVNQLLALARAEPSHFAQARLEPVDLSVLVGAAVQGFVEQAGAKGIDLGFDLEPVQVLGDAFLLRDVIDNLVDNALRYTPVNGTVNVICREQDGCGLLRVEDSGPGIPRERREAVFQRFVRLDEQTTGSGLGLAIVKDIARVHRAKLTLEDPPAGQGAVFSLSLPLA
jgi:two-component system sensor histidine kinase TctE